MLDEHFQNFNVKLWWPNGLGEQPLYSLQAVFSNNQEKTFKTARIGFRTIDLVQEPVANSSGKLTSMLNL